MNKNKFIIDIVCQVLVNFKSRELIYIVLNEFIPKYEKINLDYTGKPNDDNYEFQSENEMISCYINTPNVSQTFYWNKLLDNPNKIMVGVNITDDNKMVFSLTFNGTLKTETDYYLKLKKILNSDIGAISYVNPVEYKNGYDFAQKYRF